MWRGWLPRLGVLAAYGLVAVAFTWPLAANLSTHLTGDPGGDTGVYVWNQWVFQHEALQERRTPLTTERILSLTGERMDLSQHNYTLFLNLLALPLLPWLGAVATFNVVYLAATVLTACCAYALARRAFDAPRPEAWLAGLAFAWSPVLVARSTGHFSLVAAAPLAAFLLCLIQADRSRRLRDAIFVGLAMAWAGFCDVYYAIFCLLMALAYAAACGVRIARAERPGRDVVRWLLNVLVLVTGGLVVGLVFGGGGRMEILGVAVSVRGLYTPVLILTLLILARVLLQLRPRLSGLWPPSPIVVRAGAVAALAAAFALGPVLVGLGARAIDGSFVRPPTLWRSSPHGVDAAALVQPNPSHPLVRRVHDSQAADPTRFVEYTAALSLVALATVALAVWRAGFRPAPVWWWISGGFAALALGPFVHVLGVNTFVPGPWAILRYMPLVDLARTPTRFAVVAALGLAILLAGAMVALSRRYPTRRPALLALVGLLMAFELLPAPRALYAANISPVYDVIAADTREIRVLELPFGVRDGVSAEGDFSARYQFHQTRHGKRLIGGYLSRIPTTRRERMRTRYLTTARLTTLSEGRSLSDEEHADLRRRGPRFVRRARLGYVVMHLHRMPPGLAETAIAAFRLHEVARDGDTVLYATSWTCGSGARRLCGPGATQRTGRMVQ
ncbi:MAG: hypothetical protein AB1635_04040 [Acidobacteriota bacterium]